MSVISIVTVCLNAEKTISETLMSVDSVFSTVPEQLWEHIILDGASTDGTLKLVNSFRRANRIVYSQKDSGLYYAMNSAIAVCNGDYIWYLNADDIVSKEMILCIDELIEILKSKRFDSVYGNISIFNDINGFRNVLRVWKKPSFPAGNRPIIWHPPHTGLIIKRNVLVNLGGYDTRYRISADFKMMHSLMKVYNNHLYLKVIFTEMRHGGLSTASGRNILRANIECFRILRENNRSVLMAFILILMKLSHKITQKVFL